MPFFKLLQALFLTLSVSAFNCFYRFTKSHTGTYFHSDERVQNICETYVLIPYMIQERMEDYQNCSVLYYVPRLADGVA